jgi:hypothetical protein
LEVHELHNIIKDRFDKLDARFDKLDEKVTNHDRWLWLLRGMGVVIVTLLGIIGVKIRY